jgi:hypothetical protein
VRWFENPAWLVPAVMFALGVIFLSALSWPAGAIARRRFKAVNAYEGRRLRLQRIFHGWQWLTIATLVGWVTFVMVGLTSLYLLGGPLDPLLLAVQVLTPIAFVGLLVLSVWNIREAFREKRGWFSKLWAVALVISAVVLVWIGFVFHLFGFGTNY